MVPEKAGGSCCFLGFELLSVLWSFLPSMYPNFVSRRTPRLEDTDLGRSRNYLGLQTRMFANLKTQV